MSTSDRQEKADRQDRTVAVANPAGFTAGMIAVTIAFATQLHEQNIGWWIVGLSFAACAGFVWLVSAICWRHEELVAQQRIEAWPKFEPAIAFRATAPNPGSWGPGAASPARTLVAFEGERAHRRLVTAIREYLAGDGLHEPSEWRDASDGGRFLWRAQGLWPGDTDGKPPRRLIIIRDPNGVGERRSTEGLEMRPARQPSMVAAVVEFTCLNSRWKATVVELYALDPMSVATFAVRAWGVVAEEQELPNADAKATAMLDADAVWQIRLEVNAVFRTQDDVQGAKEWVQDLLSKLQVKISVSVSGSAPDPDAEDEPSAAAAADEPRPADDTPDDE